MSERRGTKALETWCRRLTEGYPGVKVENMTTSWRDGLAFCAIIHHFRPDLIDFSSLNKSDVYCNNSLAFRIAERHLGIPALLDAEDMVEYQVPDRLSILTYLSQFYQVFGTTASSTSASKQGSSPARLVPKRSQDRGMISPTSSSPPTKMESRTSMNITGGGALGRREPCAKCLNPVFLAERLNVGIQLYHRTCFRCARCNNQLSLANCYETETGQYCCETCPDEEVAKPETFKNINSSDSFLAKLDQFRNSNLSVDFENTHEDSSEKIYQEESFMSKARTDFLSAELMNQDRGDALVPEINMKIDEESPPPLPQTEPPHELASLTNIDLSVSDNCARTTNTSVNNLDLADTVNNSKISDSNQQDTASDTMPEETTTLRENSTKDTNRSSLVKSRMLLFEANDKKTDEPDSIRNKVNIVSKYFNVSDVQNSDLKSKVPSKSDADISVTTISSEDSFLTKNENSIIEISDSSLSLNDSRIIEERDYKIPKSQHISVSSESLDESPKCDDYKMVRSEINSDSLVIYPSVSDVNSPAENKEYSISASTESLEKVNSEIENKSNLAEEEITTPVEKNLKDDSAPKQDSICSNSTENLEETSNNIVIKSHLTEEEITSSLDINLKEDSSTPKEPCTSVDLQNESNDSVFYPEVNTADPIPNVNNKPSEENKLHSILTKSLLENLSDGISPISTDISLFNSSNASKTEEYPEDLNPFDDDEEDVPMKSSRLIIKPSTEDLTILTPEDQARRKSMNPFGSSDEEEQVEIKSKPPRPPLPAARKDDRKLIKAPRISLNPFWSDEEDQKDDVNKPVPKPRTKKRKLILATQTFEISSQNINDSLSRNLGTPEPKPRKSGLSNAGDRYDSNSSLSSINSSLSHTPGRRKKPAPPPPSFGTTISSPQNSKQSTPCTSAQQSPKSTPKVRKHRKAPLPPTSTPILQNLHSPNAANYSLINESTVEKNVNDVSDAPSLISGTEIEREKIDKDEKNRNRQSQSISSPVLSDGDSLSLSQQSSTGDKSTHGQWKRKKGPAPARPVPQRRQIRPLPLLELRRELDIIEMQQQGLEKQGVKLEQLIRQKCETPESCDDTILSPEVEELVLELFEIVNEKNELFRRQAELMYLRRQQRLEEEYADIEYQIRCLMEQPELNKTDTAKAREEELINRLVEVVEKRNEIVQCLEMDRVREAEEDKSISTRLTEITTRREEISQCKPETLIKLSKKEKKKIKKEKKLKEKGKVIDADKDIDESENISLESVKKEKKKIWFMHK